MFHIQLRKFPHNFCAFNLSQDELFATIVTPWARDQWVELGERKWNPHEARLVVLEGPHLPVEELSMGRGWPYAQHQGEDVTERVLAQARASQQATSPAPAAPPVAASPDGELSLLLGIDSDALLQAWRLAAQRRPELAPSESLALAEDTLRALGASGT